MVSLVLFSSFVHAFCYRYNYLEKPKNVFLKLDAKIPWNEMIVNNKSLLRPLTYNTSSYFLLLGTCVSLIMKD